MFKIGESGQVAGYSQASQDEWNLEGEHGLFLPHYEQHGALSALGQQLHRHTDPLRLRERERETLTINKTTHYVLH